MNQVDFQSLIGQLLISNLSGLATLVFLKQPCLIPVGQTKFLSLGSQAELLQGWQSSSERFELGSCPVVWVKSLVSQSSLQQREVFFFFILDMCFYLFACTGSPFPSPSQVGDTGNWWRTSLLEVTSSWMVLEKEFPTQKKEIRIDLLMYNLIKSF